MIEPSGKMGKVPIPLHSIYLSIDPGVTSGITMWNLQGEPIHYNELDINGLHQLLDCFEFHITPIERIIIEEFRLYQKMALQQSGSRLETVQVIGIVKRFNHVMQLKPIVEIRADAKEIAAKWSQTPVPKRGTHMDNWKAAYLIGYYWLHQQGIIKAKVFES
jgi:hypothetical protein